VKPSPRARIDWGAAKAFFVAMNPPRTRAAVARRFNVSVAAVRNHATAEGWDDAAAAADMQAAEKALRRAVKTREQRVEAVLRITDRLIDHFDENIDSKAVDADFGDLERMAKLTELLTGEATDRLSLSEVQGALVIVMRAGPELLAELAASGLKGAALERAFRERFPNVVKERIALGSGGDE
jgi:hypothetical protein